MNQTLTKVVTDKWYYIADIHVEDGYYDDRANLVGKQVFLNSVNRKRDPLYDVQSPDGERLIDCYYHAVRGRSEGDGMMFFMGVALTAEYPEVFAESFKQKPQQDTNYEW